ncbi:amidohydrolase [uncultured Paracoccus sp.]|uniref:amidohydrolase n=1 Tax=uncultured Paracoccus sp. TaxID=189685 RepID=UPI002622904F|nr:amidohydrolase [uncultured Paracoccus sp.]
MSETIIYTARRILTMAPHQPVATHVAVRDGRILAVGDVDCAAPWGGGRIDDRFADRIMLPGFVEGHAHLMEGGLWRYAYLGYRNRQAPDGVWWAGLTTNEAIVQRLRDVPGPGPAIGWGFDPIFMSDQPLSRADLDRVSADRPVAVLYSSLHVLVCNTVALKMAGYLDGAEVDGLIRDGAGQPTGELREMAAMFPVLRRLGVDFRTLTGGAAVLAAFGQSARRAGVTTTTDLFSAQTEADLAELQTIVEGEDYPIRLVPAIGVTEGDPVELAAMMARMAAKSGPKLRLGAVKLMTDGSIQGYSARLRWPGYVNGAPNGMWNTPPATIRALVEGFHSAGVQMHIHVNGDEASEVVIEALAGAIAKGGPRDHRHILQHGQLMDAAQFRRAAELGLGVNLFANHLYHFGDQHYALTVGPDRANRMNACRSALDAGLNLAIHSDAPVTPLSPLFTAWCAVNRQTASGRVLGAEQAITVAEALNAITLGAAWTLRMDHQIGSIETGKFADFTLLDQDPTEVDPMALKDIAVTDTVLAGRVTA